MKFVPINLLVNGNMSGDLSSIGIDMNQVPMASIQAVYTGSPVGLLKVQISNDIVQVAASPTNPVGSDPAANVVNWTDYTGSNEPVNGADNFVWNLLMVPYRWVRIKYIRTSGTGLLNITFSGKSV